MPTSMLRNDNLTASAVSADILAGDINKFVSVMSQVNIYAVISALGVRLSIFADSDIAIDDKEITNIGTTIDNSAHLIDSFVVGGGTQLFARYRETAGAGTIDALAKVEVVPLS